MSETVIRRTVAPSAGVPGGPNNWFRAEWLPDGFRLFLIGGFGLLANYATYDGLYQLIAANIVDGHPPLPVHLLIIFSSSLLILAIIYVLQRMRTSRKFWPRASWFAAYLVLALLSVGIGFGFYWKWLNSSDVEIRGQRDALIQVDSALDAANRQVATLLKATAALKISSVKKAKDETDNGHTCDDKGKGNGPRTALRQKDAADADELNRFVADNTDFLAKDTGQLKADLASVSKLEPEAQARRTVQLNTEIREIADRYNEFRSQKKLKEMRNRTQARLNTKDWPDTNGALFKCPDPDLESDLRRVINSIDVLTASVLNPPQIKEVGQSRATLEAFRRLAGSFWSLIPAASSIEETLGVSHWLSRNTPQPASSGPNPPRTTQVEAIPTLESGDVPALVVAAFVDFCLFIVTRRPRGLLDDGSRTRALSRALRRLDRTINADILFNEYVFSIGRSDYIFAPVAVSPGLPTDPDRKLRARDRIMALAFATLGRSDIGLFEKVRFPGRFKAREAMVKRGREYLKNHDDFAVYKLSRGALQELIGALLLDSDAAAAPPDTEVAPTGDRRTRRSDDAGMRDSRSNGPASRASSDSDRGAAAPAGNSNQGAATSNDPDRRAAAPPDARTSSNSSGAGSGGRSRPPGKPPGI